MTLVELMVALAVAGLLATAALSITLSSRKIYEADERRTDLNQHLRAGIDLVGIDLRQAGTRLPGDFPAIMIVDGGSGPDTLIVRTNESDDVMPICQDIVAGAAIGELRISELASTVPGCGKLPDDNSDGWPDNVGAWRQERTKHGGAMDVYAFSPISKQGQFLSYDADGTDDQRLDISGKAGVTNWVISCGKADQCRAYALTEHRYEIVNGRLRYRINDDPADVVNIMDYVTDFQVQAHLTDGSVRTSLTSSDDWSDVVSVELTLTAETSFDGRTVQRTMSSRFFPRNVLSL
ncbi:hypothetical protein ABI59_22595 [Acidobacteria bacterium Mor1]|nr:hypothetical protein ABI59_22595 [Acidobacteria bacterium Mor1]